MWLEKLTNCIKIVNFRLSLNDINIIKNVVDKTSCPITIDNHRQLLSGILDEEKEEIYFDCIEYIHQNFLSHISKQKNERQVWSNLRELIHIYSMSSKLNNNLLWENYANNYTGFCIEYSIPEGCFFDDKKMLYLFPVIYKKKIPSIENIDVDIKGTNEEIIDNFRQRYGTSIFMQLLYKHIDYKFEHEWRIIAANLETSLQLFPYVSRIIVGKDIKPRNLSRLRKIADNLGVPIGRQVFDESRNNFIYVNE